MSKTGPLATTLIVALLSAAPAHAQNPDAFWWSEMAGLERSLRDPSISVRVQEIWRELVAETGQHYPVVPSQRFTLGQALPNGVVLLDLSVAGNAHREVTAFWLAHEYAHQVLDHPRLLVTSLGRWVAAIGGTAQEDAADRWAARFLSERGYDASPVLEFLCALPSHPADRAHSTGAVRARNVAESYAGGAEPPCGADGPEVRRHAVAFRIWSTREGDATTLDLTLDGEYLGSLSNLMHPSVLDAGDLTEGPHAFTLSNITIHGPRGPVAGGYRCSGTLLVERNGTLDLWARLDPQGGVTCGFRE